MNPSITQLLEAWSEHSDIVERHIKQRDYRKFRLAFRNAEQCSKQIQFMMKHGDISLFLEHKDFVKKLVDRWNMISEDQIKPWKDEIHNKIVVNRVQRKKGVKINKAYRYMKTAGQSLRMKAR